MEIQLAQLAAILDTIGMEIAFDKLEWLAVGPNHFSNALTYKSYTIPRRASMVFLGACLSPKGVYEHVEYRYLQATKRWAAHKLLLRRCGASQSQYILAYNQVFLPSFLWQAECFAHTSNTLLMLDAECRKVLRNFIHFQNSPDTYEWRRLHRHFQKLYLTNELKPPAVWIYFAQERLHGFMTSHRTFDLHDILAWRSLESMSGLSRKHRPSRAASGRPPRSLLQELDGRDGFSVFLRAHRYARAHGVEPYARWFQQTV